MKTCSVFSQKEGVLTVNSYPVNTFYSRKSDEAYKAAKKVILPPSGNPEEVKLHFAMLFMFVFNNINNYHKKMKFFDLLDPLRRKMKEQKVLTCYLLTVNTYENRGEICRTN